MTIKKLLIIFLSLILAVSCSSNVDPTAQNFTEENPGGGGHLNDFGNDDLIDNGDSGESAIATFINKYAGVYYESGNVTYKLKDGKLYENRSWKFTEITEGIIVDNGNKMQISNRATDSGITGTIEVLNFKKDGNDKDGFSRYHNYILERSKTNETEDIKEGMHQVANIPSLGKYKGVFKESNGKTFEKPFLSIDFDGTIFFKENLGMGSARVYEKNGDLVIIDSSNVKNVVKFKEGNFVYRKYSRSGDDISVDSSSVTRDFVESLGETKYAGVSPSIGKLTIEFNKFDEYSFGEILPQPGGVKIEKKVPEGFLGDRITKRAILKGKTLTVFDGGNGKKIDWTLTFNDDKSEATYVKGEETVTFTKQISE